MSVLGKERRAIKHGDSIIFLLLFRLTGFWQLIDNRWGSRFDCSNRGWVSQKFDVRMFIMPGFRFN